MILQALHRLAEREHLSTFLDIGPGAVSWLLRISQDGNLVGAPEDLRETPATAKGSRKPKASKRLIPDQPYRSGTKAPPYFLVDNAKYVFGLANTEQKEPGDTEQARSFRERIKECAKSTGDEGALAVAAFLEKLATRQVRVELPEDLQADDQFAFVFEPDIDAFVHERRRVREYWHQRCAAAAAGDSSTCLVSGVRFGTPDLFPKTPASPGRKPQLALVSFDGQSSWSYGWEKNQNAPVSPTAAKMCGRALARLLDPAYPDPDQPGMTLPRRHVRLSADTVVCYWAAQDSGDDFSDAIAPLLEGDETVGEMFRSVWRGRPVAIRDPSAFYALALTLPPKGRIIVRDWLETTVGIVAENLARHFSDLHIVRRARRRDAPEDIPLALTTLMDAVAQPAERRSEGVPSHLAAQFVHAALSGIPYPLAIFQRAVLRFRAELGKENQENKKKAWQVRNWNDGRAALIKAVLNRRIRSRISTLTEEVRATMDPNRTDPGYVLGKLMAVFERLQQAAIDDANASVVDRYFSGASASPKTVFVQLYKNARHHARKARDEKSTAGLAFRLDRLVDELSESFGLKDKAIHPEQNALPGFLDQEQQGLFVIGYHQMRHWLWMNAEERAAWEAEHPSAPRAYLWNKKEAAPAQPEAV